jgi:hypothetical protein
MSTSLTLENIYLSVGKYLKDYLGWDDDKIRRAYSDNIPVPEYPYVFITVLNPKRNATNEHVYNAAQQTNGIRVSQILEVQLDFYGQESYDQASEIQAIFRDEYSVNKFEGTGLVPLFTDDIIPTSRTDENENFLVRNTLTLSFNIHPDVVVPQDFFAAADITVIEVNADYKEKNQ